ARRPNGTGRRTSCWDGYGRKRSGRATSPTSYSHYGISTWSGSPTTTRGR
ncbi:unnamed protein product, partial [Ectocarpus sp. 13 AM-2016]